MRKAIFLNILVIFALLGTALPASAQIEPGPEPGRLFQEDSTAFNYLLALPVPSVQLPAGARAADVPGFFAQALQKQQAQTSSALEALKTLGLVQDFQFQVNANAFLVQAGPQAAGRLAALGELNGLAPGRLSTLSQTRTGDFQAKMEAAIQAAQRSDPASPKAGLPAATESPALSSSEPVEYLVTLASFAGEASGRPAQDRLAAALELLKQSGKVKSFQWMAEANSFRVVTGLPTEALKSMPGVAEAARFSPDSLDAARLAFAPALFEDRTEKAEARMAPEATTPQLSVILFSNFLLATSSVNTSTVFTLTTGSGEQKNNPAYTSINGWYVDGMGGFYAYVYLQTENFYPALIEPGDILQAHQEGQAPFSLTIPNLWARVDREADTVSGQAPENITSTDPAFPPHLRVSVNGINHRTQSWERKEKYLATGASGEFNTSFQTSSTPPGMLDLQPPSSTGTLTYSDEDGNQFIAEFNAPSASVFVHTPILNGHTETRSEMTATLLSASGANKGVFTDTDPAEFFSGQFRDSFGNPVSSEPGDVVQIISSFGTELTIPVVEVTARADADANTVEGLAPPNITITDTKYITLPVLSVCLGYWNCQMVVTDDSGAYLADNIGDFFADSNGSASYTNASGDNVDRNFQIPYVVIRGSTYGWWNEDRISGFAASPYNVVEVKLKRSGALLARRFVRSSVEGEWYVNVRDDFGNSLPILDGDQVEITEAGHTRVVNVPPMTANVHPDTELVTGKAPADITNTGWYDPHSLSVSLFFAFYNTLQVTTSAAGDYTADFSTIGDVEPNSQGYLRYRDLEGNIIYTQINAVIPPIVKLRLRGSMDGYYSDNYISGSVTNVTTCGLLKLTLKNSSGAVKSAVSASGQCGSSFNFSMNDVYGNPTNIVAGDIVEASFQNTSITVEVPEFQVISDPDTDTVTGSTSAEVTSTTEGETQTLAVWPTSPYNWDSLVQYVLPDEDGEFQAVFPGSIYPGSTGHLRYIDSQQNEIYTQFQASATSIPGPFVGVKGDPINGGSYRGENFLGIDYGSCGWASFVVKDSARATRYESPSGFVCGYMSYSLYDEGERVNLQAGDQIEVTFQDEVTLVEVPALTAEADPETDVVSGVGPADITSLTAPNNTLAVHLDWPNWTTVFVTTNHAGAYSYDFTNAGGIDAGTRGWALYSDPNYHQIYSAFVVPYNEPHLTIHKDSNEVWGYVTQPEAGVTLSVKTGAVVKATAFATADHTGYFEASFNTEDGFPVIIAEGDKVIIESPDQAVVSIPRLAAQVDLESELVTGNGPANSQLNVWVEDTTMGALTGADGAFTADLRGQRDMRPGDEVDVELLNAEGHTIFISFFAGPQLGVQLNSPYAWGIALEPRAPVTLTLKAGATVKAVDTSISGLDHSYLASFVTDTGLPVTIQAGDTLQADFGGGRASSMTAAALTASLDPDLDQASGTGPANTLLELSVEGEYDLRTAVVTDAAGAWSVDTAAQGLDLMPGDVLGLYHYDASLNETRLYATAQVVYLRSFGFEMDDFWEDGCLSGVANPYDLVDITLKRSDASIASAHVETGNDGYFAACLVDVIGLPVNIEGGDQITLSGSKLITIDVPVLQAMPDAETSIVTGTGPKDSDLGIQTQWESKTVHTAADGTYSVFLESLNPGMQVYLRYRTPAGHWTLARFYALQTGQPQLAARWSEIENVVCDHCVSGQAGRANTLVSVKLTRGGQELAVATGLASSDGAFEVQLTDASGDPVNILAGDVISMTAGSLTTSMTVPVLTAQANPDSDVLFGAAPAKATLFYSWSNPFYGWSYISSGQVGADGKYFFYNLSDISNPITGYIYYNDSQGNRSYLAWGLPYVSVWENGNQVSGITIPGLTVSVRLLNHSGNERARKEVASELYNGYFSAEFFDRAGHPLIIQPGDTVVVEGEAEIRVPVVPLQASVDLAGDKVTGSGPAGGEVDVSIDTMQNTQYRTAKVDASGAFTADFSDRADLLPGNQFYVDYWDEQGNNIYLDFNAPLTRVNIANDLVDGYATPNRTAHLALKRSGTLLASADAATGMDGFFSAYFLDSAGKLVDIQAGDVVEVTASPTTAATVANLTAVIDPATDTVKGKGPANAALLVMSFIWTGSNYSSLYQTAFTDSSGAYTASFAGQADLTANSYAYVRYLDAQGSITAIHTSLAASPFNELLNSWVEYYGTTAAASSFGVANTGDLTPPVLFHSSGGMLVFASIGGTLVITAPDGSVNDSDANDVILQNAAVGVYQVQVRAWNGEGRHYALVIGTGGYKFFMPMVRMP